MYEHLCDWQNKGYRKPLVLRGIRQVGKTWLINQFGNERFEQVIYVSCENNSQVAAIFEPDYQVARIISSLEILSGQQFDPKNTLLVLDEIQEVPKALTSLKYFAEDKSAAYPIIAAGSNLGMGIRNEAAFPVGKVHIEVLRPMGFIEFLWAIEEEGLADRLVNLDWQAVYPFHNELLELAKAYMVVGGLPEVVDLYRNQKDMAQVRELQLNLAQQYRLDFAKYADTNTAQQVTRIWDSVPGQLAKRDKRFKWSDIHKYAQASRYDTALGWLVESGLVNQVRRITTPRQPLSAYTDEAFKIYFADIGLLGALSGVDPKVVLEPAADFIEHKGDLAEQFVLQEMILSQTRSSNYYWENPKGDAEVDFLCEVIGKIIPLEVKSGKNTKSKSLQTYNNKYAPDCRVRISALPFDEKDDFINIPLYATCVARDILNAKLS